MEQKSTSKYLKMSRLGLEVRYCWIEKIAKLYQEPLEGLALDQE